jgi:hypothetical protein
VVTTYKEQLLDPRWQRRRLEILERDGFACRMCGSQDKTLHVHHVAYAPDRSPPWETVSEMLITLCAGCHEDEHGRHRESMYQLQTMLSCAGVVTSRDVEVFSTLVMYAVDADPAGCWTRAFQDAFGRFDRCRQQDTESGQWLTERA